MGSLVETFPGGRVPSYAMTMVIRCTMGGRRPKNDNGTKKRCDGTTS
jgi:hypothetical protein